MRDFLRALSRFCHRQFHPETIRPNNPINLCRKCIAALGQPDIVVSAGPTTSAQRGSGVRLGEPPFKETTMLRLRTLFAVALLIPFLAAPPPAQAAKKDVRALRAECFRQANEAANAAMPATFAGSAGDRQAAGMDAYRACCRKAGIAP
jgi:hypothetical protein